MNRHIHLAQFTISTWQRVNSRTKEKQLVIKILVAEKQMILFWFIVQARTFLQQLVWPTLQSLQQGRYCTTGHWHSWAEMITACSWPVTESTRSAPTSLALTNQMLADYNQRLTGVRGNIAIPTYDWRLPICRVFESPKEWISVGNWKVNYSAPIDVSVQTKRKPSEGRASCSETNLNKPELKVK